MNYFIADLKVLMDHRNVTILSEPDYDCNKEYCGRKYSFIKGDEILSIAEVFELTDNN